MRCFTLKYRNDSSGLEEEAQFYGETARAALIRGRSLPCSRPMELWADGERLCKLSQTIIGGEVVWKIDR